MPNLNINPWKILHCIQGFNEKHYIPIKKKSFFFGLRVLILDTSF